jgi:hypothetical protein
MIVSSAMAAFGTPNNTTFASGVRIWSNVNGWAIEFMRSGLGNLELSTLNHLVLHPSSTTQTAISFDFVLLLILDCGISFVGPMRSGGTFIVKVVLWGAAGATEERCFFRLLGNVVGIS